MSLLHIKDLGGVNKSLGMRVALKDNDTYNIDQTAAIEEMMGQNELMKANDVNVATGEDSNDHGTETMYLFSKRGK